MFINISCSNEYSNKLYTLAGNCVGNSTFPIQCKIDEYNDDIVHAFSKLVWLRDAYKYIQRDMANKALYFCSLWRECIVYRTYIISEWVRWLTARSGSHWRFSFRRKLGDVDSERESYPNSYAQEEKKRGEKRLRQ